MRTHPVFRSIAVAVSVALVPAVAQAQIWTKWTSAAPGTVTGTLGTTAVTYTGARAGEQLNDGTGSMSDFDYFSAHGGAAYNQNGLTVPPLGFIKFNEAVSEVTISFAQAVVNPYMAFISVGRSDVPVTYTFANSPKLEVLSHNQGLPGCPVWFGCGTYSTSVGAITSNEFSGVIRFTGTFSSLTFSTSAPEDWHGITVGAASVSTVPEPSTYALLGAGLLGILGVARKRRPTG